MTQITKALIWAAVIIGIAAAGQAELIDREAAQSLTLVLPVLAVVTLGQARSCTSNAEHRA
jgi:hypothetical protein